MTTHTSGNPMVDRQDEDNARPETLSDVRIGEIQARLERLAGERRQIAESASLLDGIEEEMDDLESELMALENQEEDDGEEEINS